MRAGRRGWQWHVMLAGSGIKKPGAGWVAAWGVGTGSRGREISPGFELPWPAAIEFRVLARARTAAGMQYTRRCRL